MMTEFKRVHVSVSPDEFTRAMKILKIFKAAVSKDLTQDFVNVVVDNDQVFFVSSLNTILSITLVSILYIKHYSIFLVFR